MRIRKTTVTVVGELIHLGRISRSFEEGPKINLQSSANETTTRTTRMLMMMFKLILFRFMSLPNQFIHVTRSAALKGDKALIQIYT